MSNRPPHDYSEDFFADTRMTFGEHLGELQTHLWRAVYGFLVALFFSFFIGKYVLHIIAAPVTSQLEAFYLEHAEQVEKDLPKDALLQAANRPRIVKMSFLRAQLQAGLKGEAAHKALPPLPANDTAMPFATLIERAQWDVLNAHGGLEQKRWPVVAAAADDLAEVAGRLKNASDVPDDYRKTYTDTAKLLDQQARDLRAAADDGDANQVAAVLNQVDYTVPLEALSGADKISLFVQIDDPVRVASRLFPAQGRVDGRFDLSTLSAQEAFMAWFKVCIACGLVLGSPWIFYQIWLFVAAGLYPHEKRLVNVYLPLSIGLFLTGVVICQLFVIPKAIEALLWFNRWVGMRPDIRFNEWLGFAIMMPIVFGISFQLPLVMMFLERIGILTVQSYLSHWKIALMLIHVFAALITPSIDWISMELLALPMFGLYGLGILLCKLRPRPAFDIDVPDPEEPVGV